MNHVPAELSGPFRTVPVETLDRALAGAVPVVIKLGVEGYERQVLEGASATLGGRALEAVLTEDRSPAVVDILRRAGFERFGYDPFERRLRPPDDRQANALFVRTPAAVARRLEQAPRVRALGVEF